MPVLEAKNLGISFGGLKAVDAYHLCLEAGEIVGLIGPNGAGKTTVFNLLTGIHCPDTGELLVGGQSLGGLAPHVIAAAGVCRTFQNLCLWRHLSVLEHVVLARSSRLGYGLWGALCGGGRRRRREAEHEAFARRLLEMLEIGPLADQNVQALSYGNQRRVEIARALATEPRVLLLDEPTAGMTPEELRQMIGIIRHIHQEFGLAIVLIEHRLRVVMELCQRVQTLVFGRVIASGTPTEIRGNPQVIEAYLGRDTEDSHAP